MIDDLSHEPDERWSPISGWACFDALVDERKADLVGEIDQIIKEHLSGYPDTIKLEQMLSEIGEAITRNAGEERKCKVSVSFE